MCALCACGEVLSRSYVRPKAPPKPLAQLATPRAPDGDKTPEIPAEHDADETERPNSRDADGRFASICDARRIIAHGYKKSITCQSSQASRGEDSHSVVRRCALFVGFSAKPVNTEWIGAQLRTFYSCPYIQDREVPECHVATRPRPGASVNLHGKNTKRSPFHIEEAPMSKTAPSRGLLSHNVAAIVPEVFDLAKNSAIGRESHQ